MAVRSRRFFGPAGALLPNVWTELYRVPADRVARFSWLSVVNFTATAQTVFLGVGTLGVIQAAFWQDVIPAQTTRLLGAGLVLEDDDSLMIYSSAVNVNVLGGGSLLLGDPA